MSLKISKKKSVYYLKGKIKKTSTKVFLNYFIDKIKNKKKVILNIDKTKTIDKNGVQAILELMNFATEKNNSFLITGNGCKEIYDDFHERKAI